MAKIDDGGPIFPYDPTLERSHYATSGLSLRDWFAGQALHGLLAHPKTGCKTEQREALADAVSEVAYTIADAMLSTRKNTEKGE